MNIFLKNLFQYFPLWNLLDFFSWILNSSSLESWFFLMSFLESWNQLLLNLESSWFLLMNLEINLDLELVDSILKSFFWAFCHHQNYLIHTWIIIMKLSSTQSPELVAEVSYVSDYGQEKKLHHKSSRNLWLSFLPCKQDLSFWQV